MDENVKIIISHILDRVNELPEERREQALRDIIDVIRKEVEQ